MVLGVLAARGDASLTALGRYPVAAAEPVRLPRGRHARTSISISSGSSASMPGATGRGTRPRPAVAQCRPAPEILDGVVGPVAARQHDPGPELRFAIGGAVAHGPNRRFVGSERAGDVLARQELVSVVELDVGAAQADETAELHTGSG